jgi:hypothetical protein
MTEVLKERPIKFLEDPRIATGVGGMTAGTGLMTILEMIPDDIGKLATLVGIVLSSVLIYNHWRKGRIEYEKTRLEVEILREKARDLRDGVKHTPEKSL